MTLLSKCLDKIDAKFPFTTRGKYIADIKKGYPVTRYPRTIPEVQDKVVSWQVIDEQRVGFSLAATGTQPAHGDCLVEIQDHVLKFLRPLSLKVIVPQNALMVSISNCNFIVGKSAQEFLPEKEDVPEDAFFTYQMLSNRTQATYYNVGGEVFLAGMCCYLQLRDCGFVTTDLDRNAMGEALTQSLHFPSVSRWNNQRFVQHRVYGRYCHTAGKRVILFYPEDSEPFHRIFDYRKKKMRHEECEECRNEAKNYKYVEPVKVETSAATSVMEAVIEPVVSELEELKEDETEPATSGDDFEIVDSRKE